MIVPITEHKEELKTWCKKTMNDLANPAVCVRLDKLYFYTGQLALPQDK